jgi:hypothetical protein
MAIQSPTFPQLSLTVNEVFKDLWLTAIALWLPTLTKWCSCFNLWC